MNTWGAAKARRVFAALLRLGWSVKRESGSHRIARLLVVVHVYRERDDTIRLISARKATRSERTQYGARRDT